MGIMKKELFINILQTTLLPSIRNLYPTGCWLMQDNDPKHTSGYAQEWLVQNGVNWWRTPESPDINPIENLWHELKDFVKPKVKSDLIKAFWNTDKCAKYIGHLRKVIPKIIERKGVSTGY